jgi:osmotically-inducible protein OsmY
MSDTSLQRDIMAALAENPLVHADEVAAQVRDGNVILRGTAGTLIQSAEAARVTRAVPGVHSVDNWLAVRPMGIDGRVDADTEAAVFDALIADDRVNAGDIDVHVNGGAVTLRGIVELEAQSEIAERIVIGVPGVTSVDNKLRVPVSASAEDIAERVTNAIGVAAIVDADRITVRVVDHDVTLTGTVRSVADDFTAVEAAASVPGVTRVYDELTVVEQC